MARQSALCAERMRKMYDRGDKRAHRRRSHAVSLRPFVCRWLYPASANCSPRAGQNRRSACLLLPLLTFSLRAANATFYRAINGERPPRSPSTATPVEAETGAKDFPRPAKQLEKSIHRAAPVHRRSARARMIRSSRSGE